MRRLTILALILAIPAGGCYHATIDTGLTPSAQTIERPWASGWVYGLVPPSALETVQRCPNGAAKVETQLSFANQLVSFLTGGIYTPMSIEVTCAAAQTSTVPAIHGSDVAQMIERAADLSRELGTAVYVRTE